MKNKKISVKPAKIYNLSPSLQPISTKINRQEQQNADLQPSLFPKQILKTGFTKFQRTTLKNRSPLVVPKAHAGSQRSLSVAKRTNTQRYIKNLAPSRNIRLATKMTPSSMTTYNFNQTNIIDQKQSLINLNRMKKVFQRHRNRGSLPNLHTISMNYTTEKPDRDIRKIVKKSLGKKFKIREESIIKSCLDKHKQKTNVKSPSVLK